MLRTVGVLAATTLLLTGCQSSDTARAFDEVDHVHSVETDGDKVFAGTHQGLYEFVDNNWVRRGLEFDVMGLAQHDSELFASGHPGPGKEFPDPVGILHSADGGETWDSLTLSGEVDFHLLKVSETSMVGVAANYSSVIFSDDFGSTWSPLDLTSLSDLSLHHSSGDLLMASEGSLFLSEDSGSAFVKISDQTDVVKAQWWGDAVLISNPTTLFVAPGIDAPFKALSHTFANILDLSASGTIIVVLDETGVHLSTDAGATFTRIG